MMTSTAVLAEWAGDFDIAASEYDQFFRELIKSGRRGEARLLVDAEVRCRVVAEMERGEKKIPELSKTIQEIVRQKEAQINENLTGEQKELGYQPPRKSPPR